MTRYVALLRAINLGARNRVKMAELRALLEALGYGDVRTHGQTGNVALTAAEAPAALAEALEGAIARELGAGCAVVVRSRDELAAVVERNPLAAVATDPRFHQVTFLPAEPDPEAVRSLLATDVAPEVVAVDGREIHAWHPDGIGRSRLAGLLLRGAGRTGTARNWNAVTGLLAVADP